MKEEALRTSEQQLEADAIRFDAFLKENDRMAHEALAKAEHEARQKSEMVQEIKKLKHSINIVETETAKLNESLKDNKKYRQVNSAHCMQCRCCKASFSVFTGSNSPGMARRAD